MHRWQIHFSRIQKCSRDFNAPFFYYDLDALSVHAENLINKQIVLWYAVKANPLSRIIHTLAKKGWRFDVASRGELEQVLRQQVSPDKILFTGPAKTSADFAYFIRQGVRRYVLESFDQFAALQNEAKKQEIKVQALIRVQIDWSKRKKEKNVLGGCAITPFGMSPEVWKSLQIQNYPNIDILGMHVFQWGNLLSIQSLFGLWEELLIPIRNLACELGIKIQVLDLGGGLGIPYDTNEVPLIWQDVVSALKDLQTKLGAETQIWMELGRYVVGPYGCYATSIVDRKTVRDKELLILAGGVNHLMRSVLTKQPFPVTALRKSANNRVFQLHGPLCTGLDNLGEHSLPEDITSNEVLLFSQCGAYGFTESMPYFLCHKLAGEVTYSHGDIEIVREPQSADAWLK